MARRRVRRRTSDTKLFQWWPIVAQFGALVLAVIGLYYGIAQKLAVQTALFDERTSNMRGQIDTLQRNVEGLERYIVELHQQEGRAR